MENKLVALRSEIQNLRDTCAQTSTSDTGLSELQTEWENAHRAVTERWQDYRKLMLNDVALMDLDSI